MAMTEIALIAPYQELAETSRTVASEMQIELEVELGLIEEAVVVARYLAIQGVQVIVSRGATAKRLEQSDINIPIVDIRFTGYDVLRALDEARKVANRIALVIFKDMVYDFAFLETVMDVKIKEYILNSQEDVQALVVQAINDGAQSIIGGASAVKYGEQLGVPSYLIKSGKEAVWRALLEAKKVASVRRREQEKAEQLKALLDFAYEGILAVNSRDVITIFNSAAERMLGIRAKEALERVSGDVVPELGISQLLKKGEREIGALIDYHGKQVVANKVPLNVNNHIVGALVTFQDVNLLQKIEQEVRKRLHLKGHIAKYEFDNILGTSSLLKQCIRKAREFAKVDSATLVLGETGVGKEMFAQSIHNAGNRAIGPFVAINCAALPESLLESELFGYASGAFTGANREGKAGLFELAHGGTIFLDEVGEMSSRLQARLLRILEEKEVMRLGSERVIPVDVKVIAATNKNLGEMVEIREFRADLFYRLNVLNLVIPALRERKEDIPLLTRHFVEKINRKFGKDVRDVSQRGMEALLAYFWPGNVRELENFVERMVALNHTSIITADEVINSLGNLAQIDSVPLSSEYFGPDTLELSILEEEAIRGVLSKTGNNYTRAAQLLGINRSTLWRKLKKMGYD